MADVTPLSSRRYVLEAMQAIAGQGESLDQALEALYSSHLPTQDIAFARLLLMQLLRHHGQLATLCAGYLSKPLKPRLKPVEWLLMMGSAQLLLLRTPPHAAIDTTVSLCKKSGFQAQAGLVNAVLRKLASRQPDLPHPICNLPPWLKHSWEQAYGSPALQAITEVQTSIPPLDYQGKPGAVLPDGDRLLPDMVRLADEVRLEQALLDTGDGWVQDVAASIPVRLMGKVKGKQILDACAAPGGKTLQLAAAGARVTAIDRSASRLVRLRENLQRTRLDASIETADLRLWTPPNPHQFDAVLLDAPCSATGTLRRHPDLLLRKQPEDVAEMVALQRAILSQLLSWLPLGCPVIYCVCSLQPEEGEEQLQWLLSQDAKLKLQPFASLPPELTQWQQGEGVLRTLPHYWREQGGMDGFFIAQFIRST